jgi:hypothetical protein
VCRKRLCYGLIFLIRLPCKVYVTSRGQGCIAKKKEEEEEKKKKKKTYKRVSKFLCESVQLPNFGLAKHINQTIL